MANAKDLIERFRSIIENGEHADEHREILDESAEWLTIVDLADAIKNLNETVTKVIDHFTG